MATAVKAERAQASSATGQALTTSYSAVAITGLPTSCELRTLQFKQTAEAGSPTSVTGYLARDSNGDVPLTPEFTALLVDGATAGEGGFAVALNIPYVWNGDETTKGTIYFRGKVNVATSATGQLRLDFEY